MSDMTLNVRAFCADEVSRRHLLTLASLPISFTSDIGGPVDIALVGPDRDSIGRGMAAGPRFIVLDQPAGASRESLQILRASGITVLPVLHVAPTLRRCRPIVPLAEAVLVRSYMSSSEPAWSGRLEHLVALESVLGPLREVTVLHDAGDGYCASGRIGSTNACVLLSGHTTAEKDRFELDVIGMAQRLEVDVTYAPAARPARIRLADQSGSQQLRGVHESGLRLFWREVASETAGRTASTITLDAVASHLSNQSVFTQTPFERAYN